MTTELLPFLSQAPYVAITVALVVYFQRVMRGERDACDKRATERDEQFLEALSQHSKVIADLAEAIHRRL